MGEELERVPNSALHAVVLVKGEEDRDWYYMPIDQVEWTDPYYCHQN